MTTYDRTAICAYCDAVISDPATVPAVDDNDTWTELSTYHRPGCEWIVTRAHRINPDDPTDPRGYQAG